jgi:hypothetical protein
MSTNYHTAIPFNSAANSSTFNAPLGELDQAVTDILDGTERLQTIQADKIGVFDEQTVAISGGAITISSDQSTYRITNNGDLDTINGGVGGQILYLRPALGADITIKANASGGNIYCTPYIDAFSNLPDYDIRLINQWAEIKLFRPPSTSYWIVLQPAGPEIITGLGDSPTLSDNRVLPNRIWTPRRSLVTPAEYTEFGDGEYKLDIMTQPTRRGHAIIQGSNASPLGIGVANPSFSNSPSNANNADAPMVRFPTTATSGNYAGFQTGFNLTRLDHTPYFSVLLRMGADITSLRFWLGLASTNPSNVDTFGVGVVFIGFRYSTGVPDTNWQFVTADGSGVGQVEGDSGIAVVAEHTYRLSFWRDAGAVYMVEDLTAGTAAADDNPGSAAISASQDLGVVFRPITLTNAIRNVDFARCYLEFD